MSRTIPPIWHATGTWEHALGTDSLGRDYLTRIMYGGRKALITAFGVVLIAGTPGSALGIAAGYFGGQVALVIRFILSVRRSLPLVLVARAVGATVGGSLTIVRVVVGLQAGPRPCE